MDEIVEAALAETAANHLDALTMRAVADRLGSSPMALYRYVSDREELVRLTVDRVLADLDLPPTPPDDRLGDWLREMVSVVRRRLVIHPGTAEHLLLNGPTGPHSFAFMGAVCAVLRRTGRSARETAEAYDWLMTTVAAYTSKETRLAPRGGKERADAFADRARQYIARHPDLEEVVASFTGDMDAAFGRATGAVIDALLDRTAPRRRQRG